MNKFINSNIGLLFVLTMLVCAAGVEQMDFEEFTEQVGDKSAAFFMAEFAYIEDKEQEDDTENTLQKSIQE